MFLTLHILMTLVLAVIKLVCLLVAIAYFTLAERKIMAAVQRRVGPNVVGLIGLLQPLADGLKLAGKEAVVPSQASGRIFMAAAMAVLLFALSGWSTIPFGLFDYSETMSSDALVSSMFDYDRFCNKLGANSLFSYDARYGRKVFKHTDFMLGQRFSFSYDSYAVWAVAHGQDPSPIC